MKKYVFLMALLISNISYADTDSEIYFCTQLSEQAKNIMEYRQAGMSITALYEKIKNTEPHVKKILDSFILDAYDSPKFSTKENQVEAVNEFQNKWYLICRNMK